MFFDCFVGGGSVALAFAKDNPHHSLFLNDLDPRIASFWSVVAGGGEELDALLKRMQTVPTVDLFYSIQETKPDSRLDKAYHAIFLNRTAFSGILHCGPIGGKKQAGRWKVNCRYHPDKLSGEILAAHRILMGRTIVTNQDALFTASYASGTLYLDPPYYVKGSQLYDVSMNHAQHIQLSNILRNKHSWVLSYDRAPVLEEIYRQFAYVDIITPTYTIQGSNRKWIKKEEMLVRSRK